MKPIFLSPDEKAALKKELEDAIDKGCLVDGSFSFSKKYTTKVNDQPKVKLFYTPGAYVKMLKLLQHFSSEVGWHGLIRRLSPNEFLVYDILMFKQKATATTVTTDDEEYVNFLIGLTEDESNNMLLYGHSHVNMATTPSAVDVNYQKNIISSLNGKGFYLFQIWNKNLASTSILYDFENGILYEDKDIEIEILDDEGFSVSEFIKKADEMVAKVTYGGSTKSSYVYPAATTTTASAKKTASKTETKKKPEVANVQGRLIEEDDDNYGNSYGYYQDGVWYYESGYYCNGRFYAYED